MGQKRPVNVFILVTEETLEEQLLTTIGQKKELAMAALDFESEVREVNLQSGMDELKARLEILLGAVPEAPLDVSQQSEHAAQAVQLAARREKMADAGGQLLTAAFGFLAQMLPQSVAAPSSDMVARLRQQLSDSAETDAAGRGGR